MSLRAAYFPSYFLVLNGLLHLEDVQLSFSLSLATFCSLEKGTNRTEVNQFIIGLQHQNQLINTYLLAEEVNFQIPPSSFLLALSLLQ